MTVATAGRAVFFFSGLTVLLGLLGLVLFEFMILRSVGIAGAIVVGLAVAAAMTLLPAVLAILGPRVDRLARSASIAAEPSPDGPWARLARRVMHQPVAVLVPTLALLLAARAPVPARAVQRAGRLDPAADVPSREAYDVLRARVRRGRVRAARPGRPDDRRCDRRRTTSRSCTTTRGAWPRPARDRVEGDRRRRPAPDARAVPAALRLPGRPARPVRRDRAGARRPGAT